MVAIGQGDDSNGRSGNVIIVSTIAIGGRFLQNATDFGANAYYRWALVQDMQQVGDTSPTASQMFTGPTGPEQMWPNWEYIGRFKVLYMFPLYDAWRMNLDSDRLGTFAATQDSYFEINLKCNVRVQYNGVASTDIAKNGLYFVIVSTTTVGDIEAVARVHYTDA